MLKTLLFSIVAFVIYAAPARADLCQASSGLGRYECAPEDHGSDVCGSVRVDGGGSVPVYCGATRNGSGKTSAKMSTTEVVILSVGVGLVVAGLAYYFFHKKPSENNPGQISLMSF